METNFSTLFEQYLVLKERWEAATEQFKVEQAAYDQCVSENEKSNFSSLFSLETAMDLKISKDKALSKYTEINEEFTNCNNEINKVMIDTGCHRIKYQRNEFINGMSTLKNYLIILNGRDKTLKVEPFPGG